MGGRKTREQIIEEKLAINMQKHNEETDELFRDVEDDFDEDEEDDDLEYDEMVTVREAKSWTNNIRSQLIYTKSFSIYKSQI